MSLQSTPPSGSHPKRAHATSGNFELVVNGVKAPGATMACQYQIFDGDLVFLTTSYWLSNDAGQPNVTASGTTLTMGPIPSALRPESDRWFSTTFFVGGNSLQPGSYILDSDGNLEASDMFGAAFPEDDTLINDIVTLVYFLKDPSAAA